jgi:hypothetical protein
MKRGDPVRVFVDDCPFDGTIELASSNRRSIAVELSGWPFGPGMALYAETEAEVAAGLYHDVLTGRACRIEHDADGSARKNLN